MWKKRNLINFFISNKKKKIHLMFPPMYKYTNASLSYFFICVPIDMDSGTHTSYGSTKFNLVA